MNINSVKSITTQQNYVQAKYTKKEVGFGTTIKLSKNIKLLLEKKPKTANAINKIIEAAKDDGKEIVLEIYKDFIGYYGSIKRNSEELIIIPKVNRIFSNTANKIESIYQNTLKKYR